MARRNIFVKKGMELLADATIGFLVALFVAIIFGAIQAVMVSIFGSGINILFLLIYAIITSVLIVAWIPRRFDSIWEVFGIGFALAAIADLIGMIPNFDATQIIAWADLSSGLNALTMLMFAGIGLSIAARLKIIPKRR